MKAALEAVGYTVWHFPEHVDHHAQFWIDLYTGKLEPGEISVETWRSLYDRPDGPDAIADVPPAFWTVELMKAFPDVKVILTERDVDSWYRSMSKHIDFIETTVGRIRGQWFSPFVRLMARLAHFIGFPRLLSLLRASPAAVVQAHWFLQAAATMQVIDLNHRACFGSEIPVASLYKAHFKRHSAYLAETIPADKLLIIDITDKTTDKAALWEKFCAFLGHEVPQHTCEWPHENKEGALKEALVETGDAERAFLSASQKATVKKKT